MLQFDLNTMFKIRGISKPHIFMVKAGISPYTASKMLAQKMKWMDLRHLEMLCKVLYCQPNDLLQWIPSDATLPDSHPLYKMRHADTMMEVAAAIKTLPLEDLEKVAGFIKDNEAKKREA
jgi:DNA-binding Xre family transcriptional regulator